jgi:hypothetical protein
MKKVIILIMFFPFWLNAQEVSIFYPNLNQYQNVRDFSITSDGDEAFFTIQSPNQDLSQIACIIRSEKGWAEPFLLSFSNQFSYMEPFINNEGNTLYFVSDRPLYDSIKTKKDFDIWYVIRKDKNSAWSKPINMGAPVNTAQDEFYPSLAENKNLYLTKSAEGKIGQDDIYFCKWNGNKYERPTLLNSKINGEGPDFNAFIAKDESFIIYTKYNTKDGLGSGDLYMAKKDKEGNWKVAENMGNQINTKYMEYCPFYDQAHGILYFTSRRNNLKAKKFDVLKEYQNYISSGMNGLSKIYFVKLKLD